jgi:hypothetical protein
MSRQCQTVRYQLTGTEEGRMLWTNNPEIVRELHDQRIRQLHKHRTTRKPRLKLIGMENEADAHKEC